LKYRAVIAQNHKQTDSTNSQLEFGDQYLSALDPNIDKHCFYAFTAAITTTTTTGTTNVVVANEGFANVNNNPLRCCGGCCLCCCCCCHPVTYEIIYELL